MARLLTIVALGIFLVIGLVPYPTVSAPDWAVSVVDPSGAPIKGALVREIYRNYSADSQDHIVDQESDAYGQVHFAGLTTSGSWIGRIIRTLSSATPFVSSGPKAYVVVFLGRESNMAILQGGSPIWEGSPPIVRSTVVLVPLDSSGAH
jgi:hypothetical protein